MTKKVRVENADNSNYKVRVHTECLVDGQWIRRPDSRDLAYPADLTEEYIHGHQRLVVEEVTDE